MSCCRPRGWFSLRCTTSQENPLQDLIQTPTQALILAIVATIGGGLREEIQRAFILHRFEQHLGGAHVGLILYSVVFGIGHSLQGWDAVLTTAMLGAFWGYVYIARRSIVAPVVSHSGFNAAEIFVFLVSPAVSSRSAKVGLKPALLYFHFLLTARTVTSALRRSSETHAAIERAAALLRQALPGSFPRLPDFFIGRLRRRRKPFVEI